MNQLDTTLEIINDLIEINGQRIWNYEAVLDGGGGYAADPEPELYAVFEQMIEQGQRFQEALELQFVDLAHDLPEHGSPSGIIVRAWDSVREWFAESSAGMPPCVFFNKGELAVLKAYGYAAAQPMPVPSKEIIVDQRDELSAFYNRNKSLYRERQFA